MKEDCPYYESQFAWVSKRQQQVERDGIKAISKFDIEIAHGGNAEGALSMAKYLLGNQVAYFGEKVEACRRKPKQITLFDVNAPDAHLEQQYDDQQSGWDDDFPA